MCLCVYVRLCDLKSFQICDWKNFQFELSVLCVLYVCACVCVCGCVIYSMKGIEEISFLIVSFVWKWKECLCVHVCVCCRIDSMT